MVASSIKKFEEILRPFGAKLVAVTKTKPIDLVMDAYNSGFKRFGENKVQELVSKSEQLPRDIEWHMIGHLQRNKVKYIAPFVFMIHSVDSERLLMEINKQGARNNRKIKCLLQIHIAEESTKFGLSGQELLDLLKSESLSSMEHIEIAGLMGMATNTADESVIRKEFHGLKSLLDEAAKLNNDNQINLKELSMGMSNDFQVALEEGSTMIRVGSSIFGTRN